MNKFSKWLGASLGWTFGGPIGGILGFVLGSFVDEFSDGEFLKDIKGFTSQSHTASGDFEISLLVLAAVVIKVDGVIDRRELEYVRTNFIKMYGKERANKAFKLFKEIIKDPNISARKICLQINRHMNHPSRLQLIHFLFGVANADGRVTKSELNKIQQLAGYLNINTRDFNSIKAMFYKEGYNSYAILGIKRTVTDTEVKKAYRKMVKKYHPDKLTGLGKEHIKGAEEKFRQVQKAYEQIQQERGI
jgi:DnaJ like chaperone protein